jgi:hypothetical protein
MGHLAQNINLPLSARNELLNTGGLVASPFTGAVNTSVLLFAAAATPTGPQGAVAIPSWAFATNDANAGTVVVLLEPGMYFAQLYVQQVASVDVTYGISQDVVVGGFTAVPAFATAGMLAVQRRVTIAGQTQISTPLSAYIPVSPENSQIGTSVRFHATLTAGGAPAVTQTAAAAWFRIRKINDLHQ